MSDRYQADTDELRHRKILADRVTSNLSRTEQETGISFFGDENRFQITTYKPTIVRSLLRHAYAKIEWVYVHHADKPNERIETLRVLREKNDRHQIEGIRATLPIGALSIKGSPRNRDIISKVANTPEDIEGLSEVFGNE